MGKLINGTWHDVWYPTKESGGEFQREDAGFRQWISRDGSTPFQAEAGRYRLYLSHACPWAHRTLIFRKLKGLEQAIDIAVVHWGMYENGWEFGHKTDADPDVIADPDGAAFMHQIYTRAKADYTGRVTVPVLWDKQTKTIVSNESSEIIRMLNSAFDGPEFGGGNAAIDFWPEALRPAIEAINQPIYEHINNGVYRCGFATTQSAYEAAWHRLFEELDQVETILSRQQYLTGDRITEADWRLFTTLIRFDPVYVGHFKCNRQRIADYPNLSNYTRALYQVPGVADTVHMHHIKSHYYNSHDTINPTGIVPLGPTLDFDAPHDRGPVLLETAQG